GLGPGLGMFTGWLLLCGYMIVISCLEAEFALYAKPILEQTAHISVHALVPILVCAAATCYIAWRDIKISSFTMLLIEVCSISLMLILVVITMFHHGTILDSKQLTLSGVSPHALLMGLVFAIFGSTGFESAASLGCEAKDPLRSIPQAVMRSGLWSGAF